METFLTIMGLIIIPSIGIIFGIYYKHKEAHKDDSLVRID